jgi:hypothetical protein
VEMWCQHLAKELNIYKYCKNLKTPNYSFTLTIDIDYAWLLKHRGILRNGAKLLRDLVILNFKEFAFKLKVMRNRINDPADSYNYLANTQEKLTEKIRYFILCGGHNKFDANISIKKQAFRNLITELNENNPIGLHPSFASSQSFQLLKREHDGLSAVLGSPVSLSRQHFLMLSLPETYQKLIKIGISEDFTMGYSSRTGFRAGIAHSFYFYDLYEEKKTSLRICPFQVMDRTLLSYLNYTPEYAINEFKYYKDVISSVGGNFVVIWHNTSLNNHYEWKGWRRVFEEMIAMNESQ